MNRILIDTNIYSAAMRGEPEIVDHLRRVAFIGISVVIVGELRSGFKGGRRERENLDELRAFLDSPRVHLLPVGMEATGFYAQILSELRAAGTPIPTNDIWIAATAFEHGLPLLTLDRHFAQVPGLRLL